MGVTAGPDRTSPPSGLRPGRPRAAACPARDPRKGGGRARVPRPRRRPLGAASARAGTEGSARGRATAARENGGSPGAGDGPGRAGGSRAGVRAASRAGPRVTHGVGPGGSLSASASSPSPSSAAAASGCSLGPRGTARALGPSVVFRLLLLPMTGSRGGGCAGRWRPWGSRGGRLTDVLDRLGCRCCCCCRAGGAFAFTRLPKTRSLPGRAAPGSRTEPGFDVRTAQPPRARRRAVPQRPLRPLTPPGDRADSAPESLARLNWAGTQRNAEVENGDFLFFHLPLKCWCSAPFLCKHGSWRNLTLTFHNHFPNS